MQTVRHRTKGNTLRLIYHVACRGWIYFLVWRPCTSHWKPIGTIIENIGQTFCERWQPAAFPVEFPPGVRAVAFDLSITPAGSTTRNETSSTRMHPGSANQSGIPIPDRRAPCIYWLSNSSIRTPVRLMSSRYSKFSQDICRRLSYDDRVFDRSSVKHTWNRCGTEELIAVFF